MLKGPPYSENLSARLQDQPVLPCKMVAHCELYYVSEQSVPNKFYFPL